MGAQPGDWGLSEAGEVSGRSLFLLMVLGLALLFGFLGWLGLNRSERQLEDRLQGEALRMQTVFAVALLDIEQEMLILSTMMAADPKVQSLYRQGRDAVLAEGGGGGGPRAASFREALLAHVVPQWESMQRQFGVRQLHFHLGPGSLSFLRVHGPEKFGDRMDGIRPLIVQVNQDGVPRSGFETGRMYSGVRGVVPVVDRRGTGGPQHLGVLEAGTSFDTQLARLDQTLGAGFAVLLNGDKVDAKVWDAYRKRNGRLSKQDCQCYLEATSRPEINAWLDAGALSIGTNAVVSSLLPWEGRTYHLIRFPLLDYQAKTQPGLAPVGSVVVWVDRGDLVAAHQASRRQIVLGTGAAFLASLILLFWALNYTRQRLFRRVRKATQALEEERRLFVGGPVLTVVWQPVEGWPVAYISENIQPILGYSAGELVQVRRKFQELIHPEDQARVASELVFHLERQASTWEQRYRLLTRDGQTRWFYDFTVAEWSGAVLQQVRGYLIDQTDRVELENRLRKEEERVELALAGADLGLWDWHIPSGQLTFNARWATMLGYRLEELTPHRSVWESLIHPEDSERVMVALKAHLEGATPAYSCEHRMRHRDGHWVWVLDRGKVMERDRGGMPLRAVGTHMDVSAAKLAEEDRKATSDRYEMTLAAVDLGLWEWDLDSGVVRWDVRSYALLGYPDRAFAIDFEVWKTLVHPGDLPAALQGIEAGLGGMSGFSIEFRFRRQDDTWVWVEGRGREVLGQEGMPRRFMGTHTNIQARKLAELALRASEVRQRTLIASMADLLLVLDSSGCLRETHQPAAFEPVFGVLSPYLGQDYRAFLTSEVAHQFDEAIAQVIQIEGITPTFVFSVRTPPGDEHYYQATLGALADGEPFPTGFLVVIRDTTESHGAQRAINELATRNAALLEGAGEGIYGTDLAGLCSFMNTAALAMLGYTENQVLGKNTHALFHHHRENGDEYPEQACPANLTLQDSRCRREDGEWFWRKDGSGFPVSLTATPISQAGVQTGAVVIFQDQTKRREQERELLRLATTDPLTALPNRRYFMDRLEQEWSRLHRFGGAASLMMLDLDHFKRVNDNYGHGLGDEVLVRFAEVLRLAIRRMDVPGRLGGEEFAVILPGATLEGARGLAERVRRAVEEMSVKDALGQPVPVTVSIGVASFSPEAPAADALLTRADEALYRAKDRGRNRVEVEGI